MNAKIKVGSNEKTINGNNPNGNENYMKENELQICDFLMFFVLGVVRWRKRFFGWSKINFGMKRTLLITVILITGLSGVVNAFLDEQSSNVETEVIEQLSKNGKAEVIVVLKSNNIQTTSLSQIKANVEAKQNNVLSTLQAGDFELKYKYKTVNAFSGTLTQQGLNKLKNNPDVKMVYLDRILSIVLSESVPLINASAVHTMGYTGIGETVCVVDTGIDYTHPDLGGGWGVRVLGGYDFFNNDPDPMDDHNHGTHVAGIVGANGSVKGVAPGVNFVALKVCSARGHCPGSAIIAGVDWCNDHSATYNIVVTTISIGDGGMYNATNCPRWMDEVINTAHNLGILVSVASGNNGYNHGISYPACSPNAVSVGSTTKADRLSFFTNTGDLLDLLAPGSSIYSTIRNGGYDYKSGTSMAAPHVAGAAALLKDYASAHGVSLTPDKIKDYLKATGVPVMDRVGRTFPRINVLAAIQAIDITPPIQSNHSPANGSIIATTSLNITFSLNENGDCKWSLIDQAYSAMTGDCTGDGTTSQSCGVYGLTQGWNTVYIACRDMIGNQDNATTNTELVYIYASPDLIVSSLFPSTITPVIGQSVTFTVETRNQGTASTGTWSITEYYQGGMRLGSFRVETLDAGASQINTFTWTCPSTAGTYIIRAVADATGRVSESNEGNNERTLRITCVAPDLVISRLTPSTTTPLIGQTVTFTVETRNQGTASTGTWSITEYYQGGTRLGSFRVETLAAGASQTNTFTWRCPSTPGTYTFRAVADATNRVSESNEGNNERTFRITCVAPDLVIDSLTPVTTTYNSIGQKIITFRVVTRNQGTASTGTYSYTYYYDGDMYLGSIYVRTLNPGSSQTNTFTFTCPSSGYKIYQIRAIADATGRVSESNEGNNEKRSIFYYC